jgi:hypothetical protein
MLKKISAFLLSGLLLLAVSGLGVAATANFSEDLKNQGGGAASGAVGDIIEQWNTPGGLPMGVAYDADLNLVWHVTESGNYYQIERTSPHSVLASFPLHDTGTANGISVNPDGTLYITDYNGDLNIHDDWIYQVDKANNLLSWWEVDGIANTNPNDNIDQILGIANMNGRVFVVNYAEPIIREIQLTPGSPGTWSTIATWPTPDGNPGTGLDWDPVNQSFWYTSITGPIYELDANFNVIRSFGTPGTYAIGVTRDETTVCPPEIWHTDFRTVSFYRMEAKPCETTTSINIDQIWTADDTGIWEVNFVPGENITINEAVTVQGDPTQLYNFAVLYFFVDSAGARTLLGKQIYRDQSPGTYYVSLHTAIPANAASGRGRVRNAAALKQGGVMLDRSNLVGFVNVD